MKCGLTKKRMENLDDKPINLQESELWTAKEMDNIKAHIREHNKTRTWQDKLKTRLKGWQYKFEDWKENLLDKWETKKR